MSSNVVIKDKKYSGNYSRMAIAINELAGKINTDQSGLYNQRIVIQSGDITIDNKDLDCEFDIPFDDDTEANEAEITIYNLTSKSINEFKKHNKITITAGYGNDTGVIFSGYISKVKTRHEEYDKLTTIWALDSESRKERDVESTSYAAGTKASYILRKLVNKLGLTVAVFSIKRDHTFKDKTTVDGGLMENIKKFAQICGVSAYICKSKVYVCPLNYQDGTTFNLTSDTGLLSVTEFEETITAEDYKDNIKGYECKMLLAHQVQTGSIVNITTKDVKGNFRVREGAHSYDGEEFITTLKAIKI